MYGFPSDAGRLPLRIFPYIPAIRRLERYLRRVQEERLHRSLPVDGCGNILHDGIVGAQTDFRLFDKMTSHIGERYFSASSSSRQISSARISGGHDEGIGHIASVRI